MSNAAIFTNVAVKTPKRSRFDLSHDVKLSTDPGLLTPVMVMDCVPGDSVNLSAQALVRFSPLVSPLMHRVNVAIHYFFVPNRILWDSWEHFITKTGDPITGQQPIMPYILVGDPVPPVGSLYDFMGLPQKTGSATGAIRINPLAFAAYQRIYNDYYRWKGDMSGDIDPNPLEGTLCIDGDNSANFASLIGIKKRGWQHDYFTSALTASQKGSLVDIPLGDVVLNPAWNSDGQQPGWKDVRDLLPQNDVSAGARDEHLITPTNASSGGSYRGATASYQQFPPMTSPDLLPLAYDPDGSLIVQPVTINELRRAESLQTFLELLARGGSRYTELVKNFFNTNTGDARVQRSEYITGSITPVQISEVLNTTGESGGLAQGNMAGHAAAVVSGRGGSYFCREHGYIIGIMSVMPDTAYQQGIPKHYFKFDVEDFFFPQFEGLGEQPVLNKELVAQYDNGDDDDQVFGYLPRYSEYKYIPNRVAGLFKTTLKFWHWGRIFADLPALNQDFLDCNPRTDIYAVTDGTENKLYCHVNNRILANRPMRKYTIPSL
ncbi:MAG: major capsid protein [Microvirus sp.]|nr:MAG: major capsid protein [Microvirus sp.]